MLAGVLAGQLSVQAVRTLRILLRLAVAVVLVQWEAFFAPLMMRVRKYFQQPGSSLSVVYVHSRCVLRLAETRGE
jgi:hypothetical protein